MNKEQFLKHFGLTEDQFSGKEAIGGNLDLEGYSHPLPEGFAPSAIGGNLYLRGYSHPLPEGFAPSAIGGSLDLEGYSHPLPEGFAPSAIGGNLYLRGYSHPLPEGLIDRQNTPIPQIKELVNIRNIFYWDKNDKRYALIDGIFNEILSERKHEGLTIYSAKYIAGKEVFISTDGVFYSHGDDLKKSVTDLQFKIAAEKIKNDPIKEDTLITVHHYRIITGACEAGVKRWMADNNLEVEQITAKELLPLLKKSNAYGYDRFKQLVTFFKQY